MPFYKRENEELLVAPNFVHGPGFSLTAETKDEHAYPVDGWYWFDGLTDAMLFFANQHSALSCTRRQGRLALLQNDLLDDVEDAIAAIPDPAQRRAAQIEYEADTWDRGNAFLQGMWQQLGGSEGGLEDLFRLAVTL